MIYWRLFDKSTSPGQRVWFQAKFLVLILPHFTKQTNDYLFCFILSSAAFLIFHFFIICLCWLDVAYVNL